MLTSTFTPAALTEMPYRIRTKDVAALPPLRRSPRRENSRNAEFDVFPPRHYKNAAQDRMEDSAVFPPCRRSTHRRAMERVRRIERNAMSQRPCRQTFLRLTKLHFPALSQKCRRGLTPERFLRREFRRKIIDSGRYARNLSKKHERLRKRR